MASLNEVTKAVVEAMKAGDRTRVDALRMLVSTAKNVAKDDGNRTATDEDVITAGNRLIKQTRETKSFLTEGDERIAPLDAEVAIYEEYLPQKMGRTELSGVIETLIGEGPEGKAAKGFVMKELRSRHFGNYDAREANDIVTEKLG